MRKLHPATWLGLLMTGLLLFTTAIGMHGLQSIHDGRAVLVDLYQLKADVLQANIALRNAAIATNQAQSEAELAKMLITRSSANGIYDRLAAADLCTLDRVVVNEMKNERPEYREAQLRVVGFVRKGDKDAAWDHMNYYQTLMDRYIARVDKLIVSITDKTHRVHVSVQATMLAGLAFGLLVIGVLLWRQFR